MASSSIFKRLFICFLCCGTAVSALRCTFESDAPVEFVQQDVSPMAFSMFVNSSGGIVRGKMRLAWNYLLYYQNPSSQQLVTFDSVYGVPFLISNETVGGILPPDYLNRGFALGYGNYVLGVAQILVYDDINRNGVHDANEPIIGDSPDYVIVYFQGTLTQDLLNEFGALQQGYNLCQSQYRVAGVDKFDVVSPNANAVDVNIAKDTSEIVYPNVR
ncbi:MAG TPA: hypothetical protein VFJ29_02975 [Candidatus Kapabacteria bacterium]|nr:hypothetical protein [Candidatus Kapabacteria bacterium]